MNTNHQDIDNYRSALRLLKRVRPWMHDRASEVEQGWSFYYAVDTDVLHLYLGRGYEHYQYCDVFRNDTATAKLLGRLLGDFLFLSSSAQQSFILFEPHQEEFYRMLLRIAQGVKEAADVSPPQFQLLCDIFEQYRKDKDERALLVSLEANAGSLVMLYDNNSGPKAMLDRFSSLPSNKLVNIGRYSDRDVASLTLPDVGDASERHAFQSRIKFWEEKLRSDSPSEKSVHALLCDSEVVTTLEFVNARLHSRKKRVLLVTGSSALFKTTRNYVPSEGNPGSLSFDALYLRHPQAFLAHGDFFRPDQSSPLDIDVSKVAGDVAQPLTEQSTFELVDWLGILFPRALRDGARHRAAAQRRYEDFSGQNRQIFSPDFFSFLGENADKSIPDLSKEWASQVRKTALGRYGNALFDPDASGAVALTKMISGMMERNEWSLSTFRSALSSAVAESLSQMYSHAVWVGLWSNQGVVLDHSKGVPKLRFDGPYRQVEVYYETVLRLQERSSKVEEGEMEELAKANYALRAIDPSLYHMHVVHALAFATKGRWEAAIALCKMAMSIADSLPSSPQEYRRGREAAYLAAIACRRSAKVIGDLGVAKKYLDDASHRENHAAPLDVRFKSESIAIKCREILFRFYCCGDLLASEVIFPMLKELADVIEEAGKAVNADVRSWVLRQCCTNYFNLLFILASTNAPFPAPLSISILKQFRNLLKSESDHRDPHAEVVAVVAAILLGEVVGAEKDKLVEVTLKSIDSMRAVRPYDKGRSALLKGLLFSRHLEPPLL